MAVDITKDKAVVILNALDQIRWSSNMKLEDDEKNLAEEIFQDWPYLRKKFGYLVK